MVLKIPPLLRPCAVALLALLLSGCGITYLAQAARGQLGVMRARQPIDRVIARPTTSATLKTQLERARRMREFASQQLGLPDNAAYRSYADIGRRYVVWNVVATPEFSTAPLQWCFPIAGCVAYRGYFNESAANAYAARLRARGDDVLVGGVSAYSTLGRIADPLLNTVTGYSELDLAGLIFHELAHQVAWLPGDSSYNEAFATAVEEEGVARYAATFATPAALTSWQQRRQLRIAVNGLLAAARADLTQLYRQHLTADATRAGKAARLAALGQSIQAAEAKAGRSSGYGGWIEEGLNNAHLAAIATYYDQVPHFDALLREACGGYLPCLYVRVRQEARQRLAAAPKRKAPP